MKPKKARNKLIYTLLLLLIFLAGLSLLLYPTISDYWNSFHQSRAIASYVDTVAELDDDAYQEIWEQAQAYNAALPRDDTRFVPGEEEIAYYDTLLNISGNGIMGYLEIPSIEVTLPVYHGTDEEVLQVAVGHIEGSSLPVGGPGTHSVISGHRGLPSATLLTDLDQLEIGDVFMLHVLDETLTYEVDQIHIVEPDDVSYLAIEEGEDLCTLVTCTPYGINTHRLLVRGHRIETQAEAVSISVSADAIQISPMMVAAALAVPVLLILLLWVLFSSSHKGKSKRS